MYAKVCFVIVFFIVTVTAQFYVAYVILFFRSPSYAMSEVW